MIDKKVFEKCSHTTISINIVAIIIVNIIGRNITFNRDRCSININVIVIVTAINSTIDIIMLSLIQKSTLPLFEMYCISIA